MIIDTIQTKRKNRKTKCGDQQHHIDAISKYWSKITFNENV
ncbi:hypothetical protein NMY3_03716 [Candidatus Nitrosocosmicus oleophilus]|uniref:Uncharacterized protein n=1 Tax=Candidatus Nitrosocosmicus oleophilus TaxID=1353260 RepID=A0A654M3R2_9ARCH|nr:hypothetical protein NMY3_03716 [Candidatus Nitrosocosmicus oleophilus]